MKIATTAPIAAMMIVVVDVDLTAAFTAAKDRLPSGEAGGDTDAVMTGGASCGVVTGAGSFG